MVNDLYEHAWPPLRNLFTPVMKLVEKKRTGSKIAKTYDHPKTPCDRILARDQVSEETKLQAIQALIEGIEEPEPKKEVGREKARVEDPPARPRSRSV